MNNGKPFPALHDQTHEVKIVSRYSKWGWNFSGTWVYATGKPYTSPESQYSITLLDGNSLSYIHVSDKNSYRLPAYHRLDLSISKQYEKDTYSFDVGGSIFNVYNRQNVWYKEYNLETTPITVTDYVLLGFTPTVYFKINF